MKKHIMESLFVKRMVLAILFVVSAAGANAQSVMLVWMNDNKCHIYEVAFIDSVYFEPETTMNIVYKGELVQSLNLADIALISHYAMEEMPNDSIDEGNGDGENGEIENGDGGNGEGENGGTNEDVPAELTITYEGTTASVINPYAEKGVSITVDGADVVVNSTTEEEIEYILLGESNNGSFKIYSDKKFQVTMKGLTLTNTRGPVINSQTGKKMELKAQKGFVNTLTDGTTYSENATEDQKGCVFSEGQIIVKGAGTLNIIGKNKHGLCSDDYVIVENSTLNITSAKDAIHANDSIGIEGGIITLSPKGDGIDCEGPVVIDQADGCSLDITVPSDTCKAIKSDMDVRVLAGNINLSASGKGSKGIKSDGTLTIGTEEGNGPNLTVTTTGAKLTTSGTSGGNTGGWGGRPGGGGPGGQTSSSGSSSKAIKAQGAIRIYGGELNISTSTDGAEGMESKTAIYIEGGKHYFKCYDDCINSSGNIYFNGGVTVCYGYGNDAVDSNAGRTGAITIGNGTVFAYTTKSSPEEGLDCDNNSYIQITGNGYAISAGGSQGGGGGWGGSSSSSTISNAAQGYNFITSSISYTAGRYYTLADASGNNLITYSFPASINSTLALITAKGMTKGSTYSIKYSTSAPTDAQTEFHGLYLGSTAKGNTNVTSFTAK